MSKSPNYCACNHCKITYDTPQICPANLDQCCFQNLSCNNPYGMKTIFSDTVPTFFSYLPILKKKKKRKAFTVHYHRIGPSTYLILVSFPHLIESQPFLFSWLPFQTEEGHTHYRLKTSFCYSWKSWHFIFCQMQPSTENGSF